MSAREMVRRFSVWKVYSSEPSLKLPSLVHDVVASEFGQQVDEAGAADADGVGVADGG